jgi:hypothetical protein
MAKYEVIIEEILHHYVEVEANSLKEAKEKACEIVTYGPETDFDTESLGTQLISAECEDGEDGEDGEGEDGADEDGAD